MPYDQDYDLIYNNFDIDKYWEFQQSIQPTDTVDKTIIKTN